MQAAMSNRSGRIYNVGSGVSVSVNRLAELLGGEKIHIPKRPGEPDDTCADIGRIEAELGWKSQVSIECGVQNILQHIDYWRDAPIWTPELIAEATADWFKFLGDDV